MLDVRYSHAPGLLSSREPSAPESSRPGTARYSIQALASAQILLRLLGLFAQRDCVPQHIRCDTDGELLRLVLRTDAIPEHHAEIIAAKMREAVGVAQVELAWDAENEPRMLDPLP